MLGRLDPETAGLRLRVMQHKFASRAQMIHNQLTGPTTASRLECHTQATLLYQRTSSGCYRILKDIPVVGDLRSRVT